MVFTRYMFVVVVLLSACNQAGKSNSDKDSAEVSPPAETATETTSTSPVTTTTATDDDTKVETVPPKMITDANGKKIGLFDEKTMVVTLDGTKFKALLTSLNDGFSPKGDWARCSFVGDCNGQCFFLKNGKAAFFSATKLYIPVEFVATSYRTKKDFQSQFSETFECQDYDASVFDPEDKSATFSFASPEEATEFVLPFGYEAEP